MTTALHQMSHQNFDIMLWGKLWMRQADQYFILYAVGVENKFGSGEQQ